MGIGRKGPIHLEGVLRHGGKKGSHFFRSRSRNEEVKKSEEPTSGEKGGACGGTSFWEQEDGLNKGGGSAGRLGRKDSRVWGGRENVQSSKKRKKG